MVYIASWFTVSLLIALWSLAAWALHAVAVWAVSHAGALSGAASGAGGTDLTGWLAPWVPAEVVQAMSQVAAGLLPLFDSLLQSAPALAAGVTVAAWMAWSIGSVLLLLMGAGLHRLIAVWRRRGVTGSGPSARPQLAVG